MLSPASNAHRVATINGFLMALGFGMGPLLGGVFGQWLPYPLVISYIPTLLLGFVGLYMLGKLDVPGVTSRIPGRSLACRDFMPWLTWPESKRSYAFAITCCLPFLAFGVFGLYAAMSPLFLDSLVPWHGPVVSGTSIASILLASACIQIAAARLPVHVYGTAGLIALAFSNALLMINMWSGSGILFAIGVAFTALGHATTMLAGMSMVQRITVPEKRSGLFSTYMLIGYAGSLLPMMGIGWIADRWGIAVAVTTFAMVVLASLSVAALFFRHRFIRLRD